MRPTVQRRRRCGFTLPEVLIASSVMVLICSGVMSFYVYMQRCLARDTAIMATATDARTAMRKMVYAPDSLHRGLRSATASSVSSWNSGGDWAVFFNTNRWIYYSASAAQLWTDQFGLICDNVPSATSSVTSTGATIDFAVVEGSGTYRMTNRVRTFISFRN